MKLIVAVVQDADAPILTTALVNANFQVTRVASSGGVLNSGNTSLIVGVEDQLVPRVLEVIEQECSRRLEVAVPASPMQEPGLLYLSETYEVEVGGAIVYVLPVSRFERIV
ncbi:MAG TPA: cyclic-di-AMP receptor [Thermomicrobiaceae bacterium]|nr:cyclic-di-AMP receptor [Thermomicrobiaceae bacterium]